MVSVGAGLFLEDELEVVGVEHECDILKEREPKTTPRPLDDGWYYCKRQKIYCLFFNQQIWP